MGQKDKLLSAYLNRESVMADLLNGVLYHGQPVVSARDLSDVQTFSRETFRSRSGNSYRATRQRDVLKMLHRNGRFLLFAVENQDRINLCMPFRCAEYDIADYQKQLRRLKKLHTQQQDLKTPEEILSGIKGSDRLIPVVTLILFHGPGEWDAALRLSDILDQGAMDARTRALLQDYRIHVIHLASLDETLFQTNLRELIGLLKRRNDRKAFISYLEDNRDRFASMDEDVYDMLCAMLDLRSLEINKKHQQRTKEDKLNMNQAFEEWGEMLRNEGIAKGKALGKAEGLAEGKALGIQKGMANGQKIGQKTGEERLGKLIGQLLDEKRFQDAAKAARSARIRARLYKEYGI